MARMKTISSIESELAKIMASLEKAQKRVDSLTEKAVKLQKQKQNTPVNRPEPIMWSSDGRWPSATV